MPAVIAAPALVLAVLAMMALEAQLSTHNERVLRARGAVEPPGDVFHWMRVAYPLGFVLMGIAGATGRTLPEDQLLWGVALLTLAKALKFWVILSLGVRWSFRVLVLPNAPLVAAGPYRFVRHPNYLAVIGELAGVAVALSAPATGAVVTIGFALLLWRRVRVEERALGIARRDG